MTFIHPTALVYPCVILGNNVSIGPYAVVGSAPQHRSKGASGNVVIGDNTVIREFATVHAPTEKITSIGHACYIMAYAHVSHDTVLEDSVTLANAVQLGGHTYVMDGATIGLGTMVHQRSVIGAYSMIGMGSIIPKSSEILPGRCYAGNPARFLKFNDVGLERGNVSQEQLDFLERKFKVLRGGIS